MILVASAIVREYILLNLGLFGTEKARASPKTAECCGSYLEHKRVFFEQKGICNVGNKHYPQNGLDEA